MQTARSQRSERDGALQKALDEIRPSDADLEGAFCILSNEAPITTADRVLIAETLFCCAVAMKWSAQSFRGSPIKVKARAEAEAVRELVANGLTLKEAVQTVVGPGRYNKKEQDRIERNYRNLKGVPSRGFILAGQEIGPTVKCRKQILDGIRARLTANRK